MSFRMGEKEAMGSTASKPSSKFSNPVISKSSKLCYTRNFLLLFADHETCKRRPEGLDSMLWRDSPAFEVVDGGVANPLPTVRTVARRDRESDVYSKSPQDVPEWRKDSWRPGSSGSCGSVGVQQGLRRRAYDDEVGSTVSTSYPLRPATNWGDNSHVRSLDRSGLSSASGQGRWEHRLSAGDRDRERRPFQDLDSDDLDVGNRFLGAASTHARSGWVPSEGDGLLGSGGGSRGAFTSGLTGQPLRHNGSGRNRSSDQYQPPKQIKPSSNLRRDETDFINDETFGFDESTSEERVEQERKRRESFELMRKQHHKQYQESKEKCLSAELKTMKRNDESGLWDSQSCMDAGAGSPAKSQGRLIGLTSESSTAALPTGVMWSQISAHSSTPRPAVPPGFTKAIQLRTPPEAGHNDHIFSPEAMDNCCAPTKGAGSELDGGGLQKAFHVGIGADCSESPGVYGGIEVVSSEMLETVNTFTATHVLRPGDHKIADSWNLHNVGQSESKSRELRSSGLEKYASEAHSSSQNELLVQPKEAERISVSVSMEDKMSDVEDSLSNDLQVSNLAQWFHTEDIGVPESSQLKQGVPFKSLQSKHQSPVLPMPAGLSLEDVEKGIAATHMDDESSRSFSPFGKVTLAAHVANGKEGSQPPGPSGVLAKCPVFLTCEDIELSIIAEADRKMENNMSSVPSTVQSAPDGTEPGPSTTDEDGKASQLLMSLLHRRPLPDQTCGSSMFPREMIGEETEQAGGNEDLSKDDLVDWVPGDYALGHLSLQPKIAGEFPTLELLFGKAFMNELRAQDKPVSMKNYPHPVQVGEPQLPLTVSSSRLSEAVSNFSSKPSFDSVGSALDLGVSDARDVVIVDLLPRKPTVLSCEQDVTLASTNSEELWPNSYALPEQGATGRILSDSSGIVTRSHDTENEGKTCSTKAHEGIFEKMRDSTNGVQNHTNPIGQTFSESTFGEAGAVSMENLVKRTGLSVREARSISVPENGIGTVPSASSNCFGAIGEGAEDHSVAITRDPLPSVDNSAFKDGGVVKSASALGLMFSMEKSFDGSAGEGLQDTLNTKARMREVNSRPDVSAGYIGGHHPQHRATASAHLEGTAVQPHQSLGYSGFQPHVLQQTQAGLPMPVLFRPLPPSIVGLHSHPSPVHHQLQQPLMSQGITPVGYSGFLHVPYRPPQPQQALPHFGRGDFPHFGFGPTLENRGRSFSQHGSASGSSHFQPPPGHLSQQGAYHHMRPIGPIPNQFIGAAHLPQRGPFYQVMNRGPFIHDHSVHEPVTLAAKHGQPAAPIFSMNGPSLHSGPNSMIPQPGHNGRAQLLGPHLIGHPSTLGFFSGGHCVSDLGHGSKGQELSCYPSNGNAVGSSGSDRWFGMDASCSFPTKPGHGLMH